MVCIHVDGHEDPIVFPLKEGGRAKIDSHLLHIHFRFVKLSIHVEEGRKLESGELQHVVPVMKSMEGNRHCWTLHVETIELTKFCCLCYIFQQRS